MSEPTVASQWFVMRDLKRTNAKLPAYKELTDLGFEVFTPMRWRLRQCSGKRLREQVPFISDLLFVHDTRERLDPVVEFTPTLQYRYMRGHSYRDPMTVGEAEMNRFIHAVAHSSNPRYFTPQELSSQMCGRTVRILEGPFKGYEGKLLTVRGSKTRRLLVELPQLLAVGVEVSPEYIELL